MCRSKQSSALVAYLLHHIKSLRSALSHRGAAFLYETALGLRRRCTSFGLGKSRYVWQKRGNLTKSCTVYFTEDVLKRGEHLCYVNEVVLELDVL